MNQQSPRRKRPIGRSADQPASDSQATDRVTPPGRPVPAEPSEPAEADATRVDVPSPDAVTVQGPPEGQPTGVAGVYQESSTDGQQAEREPRADEQPSADDRGASAAAPAASPAPTTPTGTWRRLFRSARPRASRSNLFAGLVALGLGFALVTQVQETSEQGLETLRQGELVRILNDLTQDNGRLSSELRGLERSRERLLSGADRSTEAVSAAQDRLDSLGILSGTVPAQGPGIEITITDPSGEIDAAILLDAIEELRDAGAEAMQIGSVRVVASTYLTDTDQGVSADAVSLDTPYRIRAIGDAATMASAMDIPNGVTDVVTSKGGTARVEQFEDLTIDALHRVREPQYARPVPAP